MPTCATKLEIPRPAFVRDYGGQAKLGMTIRPINARADNKSAPGRAGWPNPPRFAPPFRHYSRFVPHFRPQPPYQAGKQEMYRKTRRRPVPLLFSGQFPVFLLKIPAWAPVCVHSRPFAVQNAVFRPTELPRRPFFAILSCFALIFPIFGLFRPVFRRFQTSDLGLRPLNPDKDLPCPPWRRRWGATYAKS